MDNGFGANLELMDKFIYLGVMLSIDVNVNAGVQVECERDRINLANLCLWLPLMTFITSSYYGCPM